MKLNFQKDFLPHILIIFLFWLATALYFQPAVFGGKSLKQGDAVTWTGNAEEVNQHRRKYNEEALWTESVFGGMPSYTISVEYSGEVIKFLENTSQWVLPYPISILFVSLICFYIFCLSLGLGPVAAAFGAFAFTFFSFSIISIEAGHNSKVRAMTMAPLVLAGMVYAFRKKWLWALTLAALGTAMQVRSGHYQISYYLGFIALIYGISEFITAVKNGGLKDFSMAVLVLAIGGALGVAANAGRLMTMLEYAPYSMRGKPELTIKDQNKPKDGGLDRDYVFSWSNAKMETFTLLIPHFFGGSSSEAIKKKSAVADFLAANNSGMEQFPYYWGDQPFTSGPVYAGAVVIFLFVLGLFIVESRYKWWLLTATLLSLLLSWGRNFEELNYFLFDYLPGYNKFRAVTMAIFMAQLSMATLAALALGKLISAQSIPDFQKKLMYSTGIVGGICLIFALIPSMAGEFSTPNDSQLTGAGYPEDFTRRLMAALYEDRESMVSADAFRSLFFVLLSAGLIWVLMKNWMKAQYVAIALAVLALVDLWSVDKRYLNKDSFEKSFWQTQFQPTAADSRILMDKGLNYRVLNLNNPFNESKTSFFHKSIGGYSPVKIRRYQDLIENDLTAEIQDVGNQLRAAGKGETPFTMDFMKGERVLNMLNTKYIKANEDGNGVITNPYALGNAWFVDEVKLVKSADEEMETLRQIDPATTAVVDETKFKVSKTEFTPGGRATLEEARSNYLKYSTDSPEDGLLVLSEVYYAEGWTAILDGKTEVPIIRANYVLRAVEVPKGIHRLELRFAPTSYSVGNKISMVSSLAILGLLAFASFWSVRKKEENPA